MGYRQETNYKGSQGDGMQESPNRAPISRAGEKKRNGTKREEKQMKRKEMTVQKKKKERKKVATTL